MGRGARGEAAFVFNKESERAGPGNQTGGKLFKSSWEVRAELNPWSRGAGHGGVRKGKT